MPLRERSHQGKCGPCILSSPLLSLLLKSPEHQPGGKEEKDGGLEEKDGGLEEKDGGLEERE